VHVSIVKLEFPFFINSPLNKLFPSNLSYIEKALKWRMEASENEIFLEFQNVIIRVWLRYLLLF